MVRVLGTCEQRVHEDKVSKEVDSTQAFVRGTTGFSLLIQCPGTARGGQRRKAEQRDFRQPTQVPLGPLTKDKDGGTRGSRGEEEEEAEEDRLEGQREIEQ